MALILELALDTLHGIVLSLFSTVLQLGSYLRYPTSSAYKTRP